MKEIKTILIIDDDPQSLFLAKEAIKELSIAEEIITCRNAFQALIYIKENCLPTVINQNIFCP